MFYCQDTFDACKWWWNSYSQLSFTTDLLMYLYSFSSYFGNDKVVLYPHDTDFAAGDLLLIQGQYFLALGEEVVRGSDYAFEWDPLIHIAEKKLLSDASISLMHWMVQEWFTTYRKVVPLWLGGDVEQCLKRKLVIGEREKNKRQRPLVWYEESKSFVRHFGMYPQSFQEQAWKELSGIHGQQSIPPQSPLGKKGGSDKRWALDVERSSLGDEQSLLVFSSIWALYNELQAWEGKKDVAFLTSTHTEKQKNEIFWKVKTGQISTLACTGSGIFQDWVNLQHICVHAPHQRYYKQRQDPRYHVVTVCEELSEIWRCSLTYS